MQQPDSSTARRARVAPGIYLQDGNYYAGFNEPGSKRWRLRKLAAKHLRDAKRERESILAALREGRAPVRSDVTLAALCEEWLATRRGRVGDRTYDYDVDQVKRITLVLGRKRVQALTVTDVRNLLSETALLADWTRYGMMRTLRQVRKMARDEGVILRDPSEALQPHERPKQRSRRKGRRLSPEQLLRVIKTAEKVTPGYAPLIVLLAYTGLRIREALALRWQDVEFDTATLKIRWQVAKDDRTLVALKTEAGERELPVVPALRRRLIEHRLASPRTRPSDFVFAATSGRPKSYRNTRRALDMIGDRLGIDLVAHDFRRSLASFLIIAARADEAAITGVLGHANIETTRRIYAADWREADDRNQVVLRQLADAGIGQ